MTAEREIILKLKVAEACALHTQLEDDLQAIREYGLGEDELPFYVSRLLRVQRLVADGLNYLHPTRSA